VNRRDSSQRGSATVLVLGVCLVAFALITAGAAGCSQVHARSPGIAQQHQDTLDDRREVW
jgi:hypothetical protein